MGFMAGFASAIEDGYNQRKEAERQQKLLETKEGLGDLKSILEDRSKKEKEDQELLKKVKSTLRYAGVDADDPGNIMIAKEQIGDMGRSVDDVAKDFRIGKLSYGDSPRVSGDTGVQTESAFRTNLAKSESSGDNSAIRMNKDGKMFGGRMMFGQDRLNDYREATGVDLTVEGLSLLDETEVAMLEDWHFNDIKNFITENKLDAKIGEKINGVEITETGMLAVAHLGGKEGLKKFIESNGEYNPSDELGTALGDYASKFSQLDDKPVASAATVAAKPRELTAKEQSALDRAFGDDQEKKDEYAKLLTGYQNPFDKFGETPNYTIIPSAEDMDFQYVLTKDNKFQSFDVSTRSGRSAFNEAVKDGGVVTKAPSSATVLKTRGFGEDAAPKLESLYDPKTGAYQTFDLSQATDVADMRTKLRDGWLKKTVPAELSTATTFDLSDIDSWGKAAAAMSDANRRIRSGEKLPETYLSELGGLLSKFEQDKKKNSNWEKVDMISLKMPNTGTVQYFDLNNKTDRIEFDQLRVTPGVQIAKIPTVDLQKISASKYDWTGTEASLNSLIATAKADQSPEAKEFLAKVPDLRALLDRDDFAEQVKIVQNPDQYTADQVADAKRNIAAMQTATQMKESAKNNGAGTGLKVARYNNGILQMDSNVTTKTVIGQNGAETVFVDFNGNPVEGEFRVVPPEAVKSMVATGKAVGSEFVKYQGRVASTKTAVRLGGEILEITTKNPAAKTKVAAGLATIKSLGREATTFISVAEQMLKKSKTGEITIQQYEAELRKKGLLSKDEDLNGLAAFNLGGQLDEIANDNRRLQAKLILMGFRVGGLEGQTGNALSNKDFERLSTVINSSPATFEKNLVSYISGHVDAAKDARDMIENNTDYQAHISAYTVQPFDMDKVTTDFENLRVWNNDDKAFSQGLLYTIGVKIDDNVINATGAQGLSAHKGKFVRIEMDEKTQKPKLKIFGG